MSQPPDKTIFVQLMQQNKGIIYKICRAYCADKSHCDDLAQEIVYQLWKSFHSYKEGFKFSTWLYRVALNVAISYHRNERKIISQVPLTENLVLFDKDFEAEANLDSNIILLQQFINELQELDRSLILLYLDDKSYKEMAEITGISVTNVATKIGRIKEKLKANFKSINNK